MLQVKFVTESLLITTGHNYSPTIFGLEKSSGKWYDKQTLARAFKSHLNLGRRLMT